MIHYFQLSESAINTDLFKGFDRYQEVKKCWRKENGEWLLKDISFTEQWQSEDYETLVSYLKNTVQTQGVVIGAFDHEQLIGFASLESERLGPKKEYLQLSSLHVSYQARGKGIGRILFDKICVIARKLGASKLYISAHSSEETQIFYKNIGCQETAYYHAPFVAQEPYDCQLEYLL